MTWMEHELDERTETIRKSARAFAEHEVEPQAVNIDRKGTFPRAIVQRMAELKFFSLPFPEEYGGAGASFLSFIVMVEELARASATVGCLSAAGLIASFPIFFAGSVEQKEQFLRPLCEGRKLGAFALTEPTAGSDPLALETAAVREGDDYVLTGRKAYITNTAIAEIYVVLAYTERSKGREGLSAFILEKGTEGFAFSGVDELMGLRGCMVGSLSFDACRVPAENRLGREGDGLRIALATLDRDRVAIGSVGVGLMQACLDASRAYAKERKQFGQPIAQFQAVQFMLADIAVELEAARLLTYQAANRADRGDRFTKEASMAKLYASEAALRAASHAVEIHGGYGCLKGCPAERYFRDAKMLSITVGTSEVQRMIIARETLR